MDFLVKPSSVETLKTSALVLTVNEQLQLDSQGQLIDSLSGGAISAHLKAGDIQGKLGQTLLLHSLPNLSAQRVLLILSICVITRYDATKPPLNSIGMKMNIV